MQERLDNCFRLHLGAPSRVTLELPRDGDAIFVMDGPPPHGKNIAIHRWRDQEERAS